MKLDPNTNVTGGFGWNIDPPLPPAGQYVAVCLDIKDDFGVERPTFNNPNEKEKRDVTRFLFGVVHPQTRQPYLVQTFEFNISGGANSNLVKFLRNWTNKDPYGFDYLELKGQGALLTLAHKQSVRTPSVVYATITGVTPVYPTLQNEIPQPATFSALVVKANSPRAQATAPGRPTAMAPALAQRMALGHQKFWAVNDAGQVVLVTGDQIINKGNPLIMVMAENQVGGWVPANTVIPFPAQAPAPPPPLAAPAPPPPQWTPPVAAAPPPPAGLPTAEDDEIPF